jgi:Ca2+/Na+ antiporter
MIARYNRLGFVVGVPGLVLQIAGCFLADPQQQGSRLLLTSVCMLFGTVLLMIGLSYFALAKGRSPVWGLMTFLSLVGVLVLVALKDQSGPAPEAGDVHEPT